MHRFRTGTTLHFIYYLLTRCLVSFVELYVYLTLRKSLMRIGREPLRKAVERVWKTGNWWNICLLLKPTVECWIPILKRRESSINSVVRRREILFSFECVMRHAENFTIIFPEYFYIWIFWLLNAMSLVRF